MLDIVQHLLDFGRASPFLQPKQLNCLLSANEPAFNSEPFLSHLLPTVVADLLIPGLKSPLFQVAFHSSSAIALDLRLDLHVLQGFQVLWVDLREDVAMLLRNHSSEVLEQEVVALLFDCYRLLRRRLLLRLVFALNWDYLQQVRLLGLEFRAVHLVVVLRKRV